MQNWADEIRKWLGTERMKALVLAPGADAQQQVPQDVNFLLCLPSHLGRPLYIKLDVGDYCMQVLDFRAGNVHKVMVTSYETLRKFTDALAGPWEHRSVMLLPVQLHVR